MSRYDLDNIISKVSLMDEPSNLPSRQPRWQRKDESQCSINNSRLGITPRKTPHKTPRKTPSRHAGLNNPKPKTPKTPIHGMDRFITNRSCMDMERSHYLLTQANKTGQENDPALWEKLNENMDQFRIMCYRDKAPVAPEGLANTSKVIYSSSKLTASEKKSRVVPAQPEKILDAPDLLNDWYLNLISWSSGNIMAVALNTTVYLWNAASGDVKSLLQMPDNEYVSSISWIQEGSHIAVGTSLNTVEIWDAETQSRLRQMAGHSQRVTSLDWNSYTLSSGSKSGLIYHHDVRIPQHHVGTLDGHSGSEICGLRWSPDGKYLASGANDNKVNIWSNSNVMQELGHTSAVKALAWCPWKPNQIATGGGTTDRHLRVWNATNGNCLHSVDTLSQISGVDWSDEYREIISAHGYQNNDIKIWRYPNLTKVAEMTGHTHRILGLCMSPDRSTIASLAADETLRFWECFPVDNATKKIISKPKTSINSIRMSLR